MNRPAMPIKSTHEEIEQELYEATKALERALTRRAVDEHDIAVLKNARLALRAAKEVL